MYPYRWYLKELSNQNTTTALKQTCYMPKRDTDLLIGDMLECCFLIFEYTKGMLYSDFVADRKTIDAVIRNFEVLGEAAKRIPEDLQLANPQIDWRRIGEFRNVLIH